MAISPTLGEEVLPVVLAWMVDAPSKPGATDMVRLSRVSRYCHEVITRLAATTGMPIPLACHYWDLLHAFQRSDLVYDEAPKRAGCEKVYIRLAKHFGLRPLPCGNLQHVFGDWLTSSETLGTWCLGTVGDTKRITLKTQLGLIDGDPLKSAGCDAFVVAYTEGTLGVPRPSARPVQPIEADGERARSKVLVVSEVSRYEMYVSPLATHAVPFDLTAPGSPWVTRDELWACPSVSLHPTIPRCYKQVIGADDLPSAVHLAAVAQYSADLIGENGTLIHFSVSSATQKTEVMMALTSTFNSVVARGLYRPTVIICKIDASLLGIIRRLPRLHPQSNTFLIDDASVTRYLPTLTHLPHRFSICAEFGPGSGAIARASAVRALGKVGNILFDPFTGGGVAMTIRFGNQ